MNVLYLQRGLFNGWIELDDRVNTANSERHAVMLKQQTCGYYREKVKK
jgi:hypothetical protein